MYSRIKLGNVHFGESENKRFENIDEVFWPEGTTQEGFIIFNHADYVKQGLDIRINLAIDPAHYANSMDQRNDLNYCEIENYTTSPDVDSQGIYYYFIRNIIWKSNKVCQLELHLDVLNSFDPDEYLDERTHVLREHRDRFNVNDFVIDQDEILISRKIDLNKEGINFPKFKFKDRKLETETEKGLDFYLMYQSQNDPDKSLVNPVRCFLIPSQDLVFKRGGGAQNVVTFTTADLEEGKFYYLVYADNPHGVFTANGNIYTIDKNSIFVFSKKNSTTISLLRLLYNENHSYTTQDLVIDTSSITFNSMHKARVLNYYTNSYVTAANSNLTKGINAGTYDDFKWLGIDSIDRTDARIIKIIMLPYNLFELKYSEVGDLIVPQGWKINTQMQELELTNLNKPFERDIIFNSLVLQDSIASIPKQAERDQEKFEHRGPFRGIYEHESKLLSSEFYNPVIFYDSFSKPLDLGLINFKNYKNDKDFVSHLSLKYKVTNTAHSKFLFDLKCFDYGADTLEQENFESILYVARNNEISLYNNNYINYIRNGYNYDVKSKQRQDVGSWLGFGASMAGTIASILAIPATGGLSIAGAAALGTSSVTSLVGAINGQAQRDQDFEQKQQQLKMQATAITNADDVDMMHYYNGNKLHTASYIIRQENIEMLRRLFFFYGYKVDYYGRPDLYSRKNFNFLQAEILPGQMYADGYTEEIKDEIIAKYKEGVTLFHTSDYLQEMENWEKSLDKIG